jgi:hypothetical protein
MIRYTAAPFHVWKKKKGEKKHNELLNDILEQRSMINRVQDNVSSIRRNVERRSNIVKEVKQEISSAITAIDALATTTESTHTAVISIRNVGIQLLQLCVYTPSMLWTSTLTI